MIITEGRFRGPAEPGKSALRENLSQAPFAGLCSKGKADLLTERTGRADHRRERVIQSANWIDILSERISSDGLHNHGIETSRHRGRTIWISKHCDLFGSEKKTSLAAS
jgi:hypothetical protein